MQKNNFLRFTNDYIKLLVISLIFYIPIIVNPGFYSHDELQIYDQVSKLGLSKFIGNIISMDVYLSKTAPASLANVDQYCVAASHSSPLGEKGRSLSQSMVF